jgi:hypothetical protein
MGKSKSTAATFCSEWSPCCHNTACKRKSPTSSRHLDEWVVKIAKGTYLHVPTSPMDSYNVSDDCFACILHM